MAKFGRGHAANKKLIASCAASLVGIEGLEGAPRFRFVPAEPTPGTVDSFVGRDKGGPSNRGSYLCGKAKPRNIRNWNPVRTSLNPQYEVRMSGDDWPLTRARKAYAEGDAEPLQNWLRAQAAARRRAATTAPAEAVQLPLAA
ncbi:MAG: hypothetical protein DMF06_05120 [Verrucomicrobia bacterium]|nr:MAG: hypothetical protein DMF06_05120 [Verrucomicrobiota bacterium]